MTSPTYESPGRRVFVLVCLVLFALNLRASVGSVGVVLTPLREDLGMSATVAGILTTLPVVCFAIFGTLAGSIVRAIGLHTTAVAALVAVAIGLTVRVLVDDSALFLAASALSLAGCAVGNVILPPLVRVHFPDRIAFVSSLYGAALVGGASLSSALTVPMSNAFGSWRWGLFAWAVLAVVTLLPWLRLLRHDVRTGTESPAIPLVRLARTPLAWVMAGCFAAQSAGAYAQFGWYPAILVDAGLSDAYSGAMMAVVAGVGIPGTLALPYVMARTGDRPILPWAFAVLTVVGWLGVLWWPTAAPLLWSVLLGAGSVAFTWVLTMVAKRTRSHEGTVALSGFTQGVGYTIAAIGPLGTGVLHDLSGGWGLPIAVLVGLGIAIGVLGTYLVRPVMLEDQLGRP